MVCNPTLHSTLAPLHKDALLPGNNSQDNRGAKVRTPASLAVSSVLVGFTLVRFWCPCQDEKSFPWRSIGDGKGV